MCHTGWMADVHTQGEDVFVESLRRLIVAHRIVDVWCTYFYFFFFFYNLLPMLAHVTKVRAVT